MHKKKGIFITFEGCEGCGKTTHSKKLADTLKKKGYRVLHTREPGGVRISEEIRKALLSTKNKGMDSLTEMLLYMAARVEIMKKKILPALASGKIVICDRFMDATIAYQGYAGGIDVRLIKDIGKHVTQGITPDVTFLLDLDASSGLRRSTGKKDRMESKSLSYHKKVRKGYLAIARKEPKRVKVMSALGEIKNTQEKIRKIVLEHIH
ncbi:MAG: dTMP kinase [Candidatus Omnitrophota bacterium]